MSGVPPVNIEASRHKQRGIFDRKEF